MPTPYPPDAHRIFNPLAHVNEYFQVEIYSSDTSYVPPWEVTSLDSWITIVSRDKKNVGGNPAYPQLPSTVFEGFFYTVSSNTTGSQRTGYIELKFLGPPNLAVRGSESGGLYKIVQDSFATYTFDPDEVTVSAAAQPASYKLVIDDNRGPARWFFYTPDNWINVIPGSATVANESALYDTSSHPSIPGFIYYVHSPYLSNFEVTANPNAYPRTGHVRVYDGLYSRDWYDGVKPPSTPPLATFTIKQLAAGGVPPEPPAGGGNQNEFPAMSDSPWNFAEQWGFYMQVERGSGGTDEGCIFFRRADNNGPFYGFEAGSKVTTGGTDKRPRGVYDPIYRRTLVVWERGSSIWIDQSDDDGNTWGKNAMALSDLDGGTHPTPGQAIDHTLVIACFYQGPAPSVGAPLPPAQLKAVSKGPGEQEFSTAYTFKNDAGQDLTPKDDSFHLIMPQNGSALWMLVFMAAGETSPSVWYSSDPNAETWTRVPLTAP